MQITIRSALAVTFVLVAGHAGAGEETLKFRLVTLPVEQAAFEAPGDMGHEIQASQSAGVAIFEDGRIAYKDFVIMTDASGDTGDYSGYSRYTFENGDSILASFTGGWGPDGDGGDYEVLSGTGGYAGVTGTGHFDGVENPWDDAYLATGSFTLNKPTN